MTRKLNSADRAAVDMIFDRLNTTHANGGDGFVAMTAAVEDRRLGAVETVLNVLAQMPAPEPSSDLAVRTLQRIATAIPTMTAPAMTAPAEMPAMPAFIDPNQPLA
ncbi:MAG TPA: hypothetical protein VER17_04260 [Tepidisphaeraceae bacterium]|nr:hypothetical protein [Tepidisphaeraceae bacterium]